MKTEFEVEYDGIQIVGNYCFDQEVFWIVYPKNTNDMQQFKEFDNRDMTHIQVKLYIELEDYINYIRESYGEDLGYDSALDQAVEIERNM